MNNIIDSQFIGKIFNYTEIIDKKNNEPQLWYDSLQYINIVSLFTYFFKNMDLKIQKAIDNNNKSIIINYPKTICKSYVNNDYFDKIILDFNNIVNEEFYYGHTINIFNVFNVSLFDTINNKLIINDKLLPFCKKITHQSGNNQIYLSIYYKEWFNKFNTEVESPKPLLYTLSNICSDYIPIQFIEYLFKINNLDFKKIVENKIIGIKEIKFNNYDLEIFFY